MLIPDRQLIFAPLMVRLISSKAIYPPNSLERWSIGVLEYWKKK
jgi:hypothetical protein